MIEYDELKKRNRRIVMWIVAKIKNKEFHTFKRSLNERLSFKPELYSPKIIIDSFIKNKQKKR